MEGSGRMLVTAVGLKSQSGIIVSLLGGTAETKEKTPLTKKKNSNKYIYYFLIVTDINLLIFF